MKYNIVDARHEHIPHLAATMRLSDEIEVWASGGLTPTEALTESLDCSTLKWTAELEGLPVAMFGACPLEGTPYNLGGIWLLANPEIYVNKRDFMLNCRVYLAAMHDQFEYLTNFVDVRNKPSHLWLKVLRFQAVQEVHEYGHDKVPFIQYVSKRN